MSGETEEPGVREAVARRHYVRATASALENQLVSSKQYVTETEATWFAIGTAAVPAGEEDAVDEAVNAAFMAYMAATHEVLTLRLRIRDLYDELFSAAPVAADVTNIPTPLGGIDEAADSATRSARS